MVGFGVWIVGRGWVMVRFGVWVVVGLWVKWVVGRQSSPVLQGHGEIGVGHGDEFGGDWRGSPHG